MRDAERSPEERQTGAIVQIATRLHHFAEGLRVSREALQLTFAKDCGVRDSSSGANSAAAPADPDLLRVDDDCAP
jgi:hypothetical protein